jgi:hypothetical protein
MQASSLRRETKDSVIVIFNYFKQAAKNGDLEHVVAK